MDEGGYDNGDHIPPDIHDDTRRRGDERPYDAGRLRDPRPGDRPPAVDDQDHQPEADGDIEGVRGEAEGVYRGAGKEDKMGRLIPASSQKRPGPGIGPEIFIKEGRYGK